MESRRRLLLVALLAAAVAARLAIALTDHRRLIALDLLQDDAFYYFTIARNLAAGKGLSFDGSTPTNGFQPLYLLLLAPLTAVFAGDLAAPVRAAGVASAILAGVTGLLAWRLTGALAGRTAAWVALALFAFSPYLIAMSVNGQETGLALLLALALVYSYVGRFRSRADPPCREVLGFGALCGLGILARLDLALLGLAALLDWCRLRWRERQLRRALPRVLAAAAAAGLVWSVWGIVSRVETGAWLPVSGLASRTLALHYGWINLEPLWGEVPRLPRAFDPEAVPGRFYADVATRQLLVFLFDHPLLAPLRFHIPFGVWPALEHHPLHALARRAPLALIALLAVASGACILLAQRARRADDGDGGRRPSLAGLLAPYLALHFAGYTFGVPAHWYFSRYLAVPVLLTTLHGLARLDALVRNERARRAAGLCAIALVVWQAQAFLRYAGPRLTWAEARPGGFLRSWQALGPRVPPEKKLGAFQAGIYGYFSGRSVVNLDGKVNLPALDALRAKQCHRYVREAEIDYVLDFPSALIALCTRHMPAGELEFRPVARTEDVTLFEVIRGPPPPRP